MLRKWGTLVLFLLATPALLLAQSTGKIAGTVVDAETGETLPGASVILEGTTLGAATDIDGEYQIFEVPPGIYTVVASYTGYATERRANVEIISGITNRLEFSLRPATAELAEIQVVAERPLVNPTATNAVRRLGAEQITSLPTRDPSTYYAIQPGVTVLNDEVYIRGGRPDETQFLLEGMTSRSVVGADNVIPVIPEALEEVQVLAGGYSAEYGGANAGIVQQVLRTGGSKLSALVQYETDGAASAVDAYSYGYNNLTATLGGPLATQKIRFFGALNYEHTDNTNPMFWYGADLGTPVDVLTRPDPKDANAILPDTAYKALTLEDGTLPGVQRPGERLKLNGTLLFDLSPLRVRVSYAQVSGHRRLNDTPVFNFFNQERIQKRDDFSRLASVQATYFLSNKTYLQGAAGFFDYNFEIYDPLFGKPTVRAEGGVVPDLVNWYNQEAVRKQLEGDPAKAALYTKYWNNQWTDPDNYIFNAFDFARPGAVDGSYQKRTQSYYDLQLSLTSQIQNHYLVAGTNYRFWRVRNYAFNGSSFASLIDKDSTYLDAIKAESPDVARKIRQDALGGYGYDEFMNEVNDGANGPKRPLTAAVYVNDRIEFNDIILNAGLRYDYFDMDLFDIDDPANPDVDLNAVTIGGLRNAPGKGYLQPRLGMSFPVTDQTAFHLQYGKFAQMPDMTFVYRSIPFLVQSFAGKFFVANPFAWDLDPIRSTQYEIGVGHQFTDFAAFDVTAFYRKTQGQLEIVRQETEAGSQAADYNVYQNGDFAIARGVELSLRTRRIHDFMAMFNYTLTDAKGTNSEPGGQVAALENGSQPPTLIQPLSFEERHRGSIILDYHSGEGTPLTENWVVDLLTIFHSGHRFTHSGGSIGQQSPADAGLLDTGDPRSRVPLEPLNASVAPWYFNTDLRVEKGFDFGGVRTTVYGYVTNLLNRKNVLNVYLRSGSPYSDNFLTTPELSEKIIAGQGPEYVKYYQALNLQNRQSYIGATGNDLFAQPRQFRLGVRVDF
ncbi:MAG TPA: TonB-dependent receptor [Rhodothermales bacterium]|nr:TonB-dependent receptor [Rhodothermales bacterium]